MNECIHYKLAHSIKHLLQHENSPPLLLYGVANSGKTFLIKHVIHMLWEEEPLYKIDDVVCNYFKNSHCYYFECEKIKDKKKFLTFIESITKTYNYYIQSKYLFIFDNLHLLDKHFQSQIASILETYKMNSNYIILTNNYSMVPVFSRSLCQMIRVPLPSISDKIILIEKICDKSSIPYNQETLHSYCRKHITHTIPQIMNYIKYTSLSYTSLSNTSQEYMEITPRIIHDICEMFTNPFNIDRIKEISFTIKKFDIHFHILSEKIISFLILQKKYSSELFIDIVELCSKYDFLCLKSYREIIYIESFLIHLYDIVNIPKQI